MNLRLTPIVQNLIILNVIIFVGLSFIPDISRDYFMIHKTNALGLYETVYENGVEYIATPDLQSGGEAGKFLPLQIVTNFFNHGGLLHLVFNMVFLAFLGPMCEMVLGSKRFLKFYLFCGVAAGIMLAFLDPSPVPVLGASTAVSGIMVAFAMMFPRQKMQLLFIPIEFEARQLVLGYAAITVILLLMDITGNGASGNISHFGHLAGMISAVIFFYMEKYLPFLQS